MVAIFASSFSILATEVPGGACACVGAAPVRRASAKIPRNPLATPDFMFPFAQTKGSTAALPALSTLALSCSLAGASAVPVGAVPFVNDSLQEKYSRQMLFAGIGPEGQQRLLASRAVIVGCGAIGAAASNLLFPAVVGYRRIIDRDFVDPSNLQRQTLFDASDALNVLPKAVAAERQLRSINSSVAGEGVAADLSPPTAAALLDVADLHLDRTRNVDTASWNTATPAT